MTFWKRQKYGDSKISMVSRDSGWEVMSRQSTVDIKGSENTMYDIIMMGTHHYTLFKPIECTTPSE